MTWVLAVATAALAVLVGASWYGSTVLFHPPKRLALEIWPDRYGFPYEPIEFKAKDGIRLRGWLIPAAAPSDRSLLLCHGWGDNKGDMLERTEFLRSRFNLFYFDFRYHGDSEGDRTTLCAWESWDIAAALDQLRKVKPDWTRRLGIFGYSMGSGPGTWLCAQNSLIKALLIEAPFASFNGVLTQWAWNVYRIPFFPVVWGILWACRFRLGMNPEPLSPIHQIDKVAPRPVFIIAGEQDDLMLPATVRKVFEKAREPKELWVVQGAGHGKSHEVAKAEYERRIVEFFERHL